MKEQIPESNPLEKNYSDTTETPLFIIPPQYKGLTSEALEEIWTIPIYVDPEKTKSELARKKIALETLSKKELEREIGVEDASLTEASDQARIVEIEKQLGISKQDSDNSREKSNENIELMSLEDFANWLVGQVRESGNSLNKAAAYNILTARREFRKLRVASAFGNTQPLLKAYNDNEKGLKNFTHETEVEMKSLDGVKYVSGTWDHYRIGDERNVETKTHKGYLTISIDQVLTQFSPQVRKEIVKNLRDQGYKGQVKFPVTGSRALFSYDNIILHGNTLSDVEMGLKIAQNTLTSFDLKYEEPQYGVDAEGVDGKKTSYTDRIAQLVEQATKTLNFPFTQEIEKLKD